MNMHSLGLFELDGAYTVHEGVYYKPNYTLYTVFRLQYVNKTIWIGY